MASKKKTKPPASDTLLVELLTEELPPKSLPLLSKFFADEVANGLVRYQLKDRVPDWRGPATPRRLAVIVPDVLAMAQDRSTEIAGPSTKAPPEAVAGFAKKHAVDVKALEQRETPKGTIYVARVALKGAALDAVLAKVVDEALRKLPAPKTMRWGDGEAQFVRPVHGLMMLHGSRVVPGAVMGCESGNRTLGHRFLSSKPLTIRNARDYEGVLRKTGMVIGDFDTRKREIERAIRRHERRLKLKSLSGGDLTGFAKGALLSNVASCDPELRIATDELLGEVTALVEYPAVYPGHFDKEFLELPMECLTLSMRQHQRYFPCFDLSARLAPTFLVVSNVESRDPAQIVHGNERVLRARLADARFFFDQDRKTRLETRVSRLSSMVYHNKLGSQLERVERIRKLAGTIARELKADGALAERAAWLSKADLLTEMVGEFPELQGIIGRYYALHDGEPKAVADAVGAHYRPRFAGDALPEDPVSTAVSLADKLDMLAGLFGVGQAPTGDRDPFALRRAALGVVRILVERNLPLSLHELINAAFKGFSGKIADTHADLQPFIYDRLSTYLKERGHSTLEVESVVSKAPAQINLVPRQLEAVRAFNKLPEALSLAAANKRVVNILKQAAAKGESFANVDAHELKEPAERALFEALKTASQQATPLLKQGDFTGYLKTFAILKSPVDAFFDTVMVMVEDRELRKSRLALLTDLRNEMNRIADISKLAA